jgi:S-adenosyl methyltransferase
VTARLCAEAGGTGTKDRYALWPRTAQLTHEAAQSVAPDCRVVYVDNDPIVLTHARALLRSSAGTTDYLDADLREPAMILRGAARTLRLSEPVAIMLVAVLHHIRTPMIRTAWSGSCARPWCLYAGMNSSLDQICADYREEQLEVLAGILGRTADAGRSAVGEVAGG